MNKYYDRLTIEQQQVVEIFKLNVEDEVLNCLDCLYEIDKIGDKGRIPLPATSSSGKPVLHGANQIIHHLRNYYLKRIALVRQTDRETYEKWVPDFYKVEASKVGI